MQRITIRRKAGVTTALQNGVMEDFTAKKYVVGKVMNGGILCLL